MNKKIILASTSPRRKQLMTLLSIPFEAVASEYEEDMTLDLPPRELVQHLAFGKAQAVAEKYKNAIVIGGDSIIVFGNHRLGKPKTPENAREMLELLRGTTHQQMTGLAIIDTETGIVKTDVSVSYVTFRSYSDQEIENYINTNEPFGHAGAYAIQGYASLFADKIQGDYFGILGLSVTTLARLLNEFGIDVWDFISENSR